jgi:hypothetical protein
VTIYGDRTRVGGYTALQAEFMAQGRFEELADLSDEERGEIAVHLFNDRNPCRGEREFEGEMRGPGGRFRDVVHHDVEYAIRLAPHMRGDSRIHREVYFLISEVLLEKEQENRLIEVIEGLDDVVRGDLRARFSFLWGGPRGRREALAAAKAEVEAAMRGSCRVEYTDSRLIKFPDEGCHLYLWLQRQYWEKGLFNEYFKGFARAPFCWWQRLGFQDGELEELVTQYAIPQKKIAIAYRAAWRVSAKETAYRLQLYFAIAEGKWSDFEVLMEQPRPYKVPFCEIVRLFVRLGEIKRVARISNRGGGKECDYAFLDELLKQSARGSEKDRADAFQTMWMLLYSFPPSDTHEEAIPSGGPKNTVSYRSALAALAHGDVDSARAFTRTVEGPSIRSYLGWKIETTRALTLTWTS